MGRLSPWMIVVAAALAFPLAVLVFSGGPAFPSRDECVRPATQEGDTEVVFGYFDTHRDAAVVRDRAVRVGFQGTRVERNACGLVRVVVGGIPTLEVGRELAEEARSVGLEATLEQAG